MRIHRYSTALRILAAISMATSLVATAADGQPLVITRAGDRQVREAPPSNFTGVARVDVLFDSLVNAEASDGAGPRARWRSLRGRLPRLCREGHTRADFLHDAAA